MPQSDPRPASNAVFTLEHDLARDIVQRGAKRYFAARRALIPIFVSRNFSLRGALALHRRALGWDIARAPVNLILAPPHLALKLAAPALEGLGARRMAAILRRRGLLLETDVAREVAWRVQTGLLELPYRQPGRIFQRDALLEAILADRDLLAHLQTPLAAIGRAAHDDDFRRRLEEAMLAYAGTRPAAAEVASGLLTTGIGALTVKQLTPGALTLGPLLAGAVAQQAAITSFPLGAALGGVWYAWFPAATPLALIGGVTVGLMAAAAVAASFAGILADPMQRALGLHQRRLERLVDALERHFEEPASRGFVARDHYVARLLDLVDLVAGACRLTAP